jgi:hypothetical protein
MDITSLSTDLSQANVQQEASLRLQKMAMDGAKDQGAELVKMIASASPAAVTDPQLGNNINFLA